MPEETPADRLRTAAATLRRGFARGQLCTSTGERCVVGAIIGKPDDVMRGRMLPDACLAEDFIAHSAIEILHRYLTKHPISWSGVPPLDASDAPLHGVIHGIMWWSDRVPDGDSAAAVLEKVAAWWEEGQ